MTDFPQKHSERNSRRLGRRELGRREVSNGVPRVKATRGAPTRRQQIPRTSAAADSLGMTAAEGRDEGFLARGGLGMTT